jgi:hypothetical protein
VSDDLTTSTPPITPAPAPAAPVPPAPEPVRVTPPAPRRSSSGRWVNVLLAVAVAVAIGGVAFAVGRSTAPVAAAGFGRFNGTGFPSGSFNPDASGAPGQGRFGGFGLAGGITIDGTVQSVTGDTLTVKAANGQTIEVTLDSDTAYHQQASATASDVTVGSSVAVQVSGGFGRGNGNGNGGANGGTGGNGGGTAGGPTVTATDVTVIP